MDKNDLLADVQEIFRDVFDEDELQIHFATNAKDIEEWDSLAQIRLTVAIEKRYNIKFAFGELQNLNNVGEMLDVILEKIAAR